MPLNVIHDLYLSNGWKDHCRKLQFLYLCFGLFFSFFLKLNTRVIMLRSGLNDEKRVTILILIYISKNCT